MIDKVREAEAMLRPLVQVAEAYKKDGGRKAGTILSKVRNAHQRCVEAIAVIDSVVVEAATLGASPVEQLKSTKQAGK